MDRIIQTAQKITTNRYFNLFIFLLIFLSAVIIGLETYPGFVQEYHDVLLRTDQIIIAFFVIEIALKIISRGRRPWTYFSDPWNVFDFLIVALCVIPVGDTHYIAVFRILRVLRILRMITVFPKLKLIIGALLKSIPSMGYVIMLIGILFYVYAITGVFVFGKADPMHFGDLHHALVTLFKVLTLEGWTEIMNVHIYGNAVMHNMQIISIWPFLYFASFILIGAMIILNLFIGVIMNSMDESQKELSEELNGMKDEDHKAEEQYRQIMARLDEISQAIEKNGQEIRIPDQAAVRSP